MRFFSDNAATACPEILAAIQEANRGLEKAYGDDPWTQRLDAVFGEYFGTEVKVFPRGDGNGGERSRAIDHHPALRRGVRSRGGAHHP